MGGVYVVFGHHPCPVSVLLHSASLSGFWHSVIPTSFFIFNVFIYTLVGVLLGYETVRLSSPRATFCCGTEQINLFCVRFCNKNLIGGHFGVP